MSLIRSRLVLPLLLLIPSGTAHPQAAKGYALLKRIAVGGEGGWDYLTVDPGAQRLYVSHATQVDVVDLRKGALVGNIPNTPGVHGIALARALNRGYISSARDSAVTIFDLQTLATISRVKVPGRNPDAIAFDSSSGRVFTFNGGSANATAIDAATGQVVGSMALSGKPEFAVADGRGKMYVNIEDKSTLVRFDPKSLTVEAEWPLAPCEEPSGLAIDRQHRRLFSVCGNKLMAVTDGDSGHLITTLPIGEGVDGAEFDPGAQLAFASNGDGTLTVVHEDDPATFRVIATVPTQRGARTIALEEPTHRLYLPTAEFGPPPEPTPDRPRPRPSVVAGTFVVLVVGPK